MLGSTDVQGRSCLPAWTAELRVEMPFPPTSLGLPSRLVCDGEVGIWVQAGEVPGGIWSPDAGGLCCPWRNQAQRAGGAELRLASPDSQPRTSPLLCPWQVGRLRQMGHVPAWHGRGRKCDRRVFSWLVFRALSCFLFPRADGIQLTTARGQELSVFCSPPSQGPTSRLVPWPTSWYTGSCPQPEGAPPAVRKGEGSGLSGPVAQEGFLGEALS